MSAFRSHPVLRCLSPVVLWAMACSGTSSGGPAGGGDSGAVVDAGSGADGAPRPDAAGAGSLSDMEKLRQVAKKRVYFQHASVGGESVGVYEAPGTFVPPWGIQKIMADNPGSGLTLGRDATTAAAIPVGTLGEYSHGAQNGDPDQKLTMFDQFVRAGLGGAVDIAIFKLGTPDIDQTTGNMATSGTPQATWFSTVYKPKMDALAALYPTTLFAHATVPIHASDGYYGNDHYEEWNKRIRETYPGRVFDVAYWESVNAAGERAYSPDGAPCIHADWAIPSDSHVNEAGANWLGEKLLEFLVSVM